MYIAKRPFRNAGQIVVPGSVVEPGTTKHFKARLGDNHIVEVNEHNFDKWKEFFAVRYNVQIELPKVEKLTVEEPKVEEPKVEEPKVTKATVKATATK